MSRRSDRRAICPQGHECRPATGLTCMVRADYYWCGKCISTPRYIARSGEWARGMYYPPRMVKEVVDAC